LTSRWVNVLKTAVCKCDFLLSRLSEMHS
jgi:hypothetical protein